jgi:uncharacterized protein involved in high-affinity Fe2+ transport
MHDANAEEAKKLLAQTLSEIAAEGEDWRSDDYYLTLEPNSADDGSHWGTSVKNEKTDEVRAVNFNIEPAD